MLFNAFNQMLSTEGYKQYYYKIPEISQEDIVFPLGTSNINSLNKILQSYENLNLSMYSSVNENLIQNNLAKIKMFFNKTSFWEIWRQKINR